MNDPKMKDFIENFLDKSKEGKFSVTELIEVYRKRDVKVILVKAKIETKDMLQERGYLFWSLRDDHDAYPCGNPASGIRDLAVRQMLMMDGPAPKDAQHPMWADVVQDADSKVSMLDHLVEIRSLVVGNDKHLETLDKIIDWFGEIQGSAMDAELDGEYSYTMKLMGPSTPVLFKYIRENLKSRKYHFDFKDRRYLASPEDIAFSIRKNEGHIVVITDGTDCPNCQKIVQLVKDGSYDPVESWKYALSNDEDCFPGNDEDLGSLDSEDS